VVTSTLQLRHYDIRPDGLQSWITLFQERIVPLRRRLSFEVQSPWANPTTGEFGWLFSYPGDEAAFQKMNAEYEDLPEHDEIHRLASAWIVRMDMHFVTPIHL
jgi:hypothetical protein